MENFAKILMYLEITGFVLGCLGTLFTVVLHHMDSTWQNFMAENEVIQPSSDVWRKIVDGENTILQQNDHEYQYFRNIYQTQSRSTKCDGFVCIMMVLLLSGVSGHISCSVLSKKFREKMDRHKAINKVISFISIVCTLFLLYTLIYATRPYDAYIEKTFYSDNESQQYIDFEPQIHWPCYLLTRNASQHPNDEGLVGPHICQYKLYKIVSVILYLCYATISMSIIHLISREEMNRLVGIVEDRLNPMRRRIQCCIRRAQVAASEELQPRRLQDSNATLISGNINVQPSGFSSSPTIYGLECLPIADIENANDEQPPPPYPTNEQTENAVNLPMIFALTPNLQNVDNTGTQLGHISVPVHGGQRSPLQPPPPSYSSTVVALDIKNWRKP